MPTRQASTPRVLHPPDEIADRLHSSSIHLLRKLRREDDASGLSAPRLSALSVVVFGGPITIGALAAAEQVRVSSMSRLVAGLEKGGFLRRAPDGQDGRVVRLEATTRGKTLLQRGRKRRIDALARAVAELSAADGRLLQSALPIFERLSAPD